ncbi:hypothetical protein [Desulfurobacterium sp.]
MRRLMEKIDKSFKGGRNDGRKILCFSSLYLVYYLSGPQTAYAVCETFRGGGRLRPLPLKVVRN